MERRYSFSPNESEKYRAQVTGDSTSRHIRGTGIVFNQRSKIIFEWVEDKQEYRTFFEVIDPTALDAILNNGFDVVADVNHDFAQILARIAAGTLTLTKDNVAVYYDFDALETERGNDVLLNVRAGNYYESSFAFIVAEDKWELDEVTGLYIRTILRFEMLYDIAVCTYRGAYNNTDIENNERILEYNKEDIEVATRKLNDLLSTKSYIGLDLSTTNDKTVETIIDNKIDPNKESDDDFITRIYLKRSWDRKIQKK